jgi:hypothetical protein
MQHIRYLFSIVAENLVFYGKVRMLVRIFDKDCTIGISSQ